MREATFARQIELGIVPEGHQAGRRSRADIKDWDKLTRRREEAVRAPDGGLFAAFGEYTDYEIGRLFDAIGDTGQLDNTLIFYIIGDNGTSAEGGMNGMFNEMTYFNGVGGDGPGHAQALRRLGRPRDLSAHGRGLGRGRQHAVHVDQADCLQLRRHPQRHDRLAGPSASRPGNEVRSQWHHVIDVAPTVLEAAGLPEPKSVNGVVQAPIEGVSMVYTFDDADGREHATRPSTSRSWAIAPSTTTAGSPAPSTGHPGSRSRGASCRRTSGSSTTRTNDFSQTNDLAAIESGQAQGAAGPLHEGGRAAYRVLPIDDRVLERVNPAIGGPARPDGRTARLSRSPKAWSGMSENVFINIKNRSFSITADVEIPAGRGERRDPRPGGPLRRLEPVPQGRQADLHATTSSDCRSSRSHAPAGAGAGQGHGAHELRLRRRRNRQGRHGHHSWSTAPRSRPVASSARRG